MRLGSRNVAAVMLGGVLGMTAYTLHVPLLAGIFIASAGALVVRQVIA